MDNNLKLVDQQFPLPYNAYAAFDAVTLKQLMLDRLNANSVFTDQIYEGSNFNNFIDVIAYSYNVLLYYLNKTSNESLFGTSQIYENMNKIVKTLSYNPIGFQSSILKFEATANVNFQPGIYTIPRYSYFTINDIKYSFVEDTSFIKTVTGEEFLKGLSDESYLVQGNFREYPLYPSNGSPFEQIIINSIDEEGNNVKIDHNSIDVYVRNEDGTWEQWTRVENLFLGNGNDKIFECRLNENQKYTVKFGNNITGKQLNLGNVVAIYYLETDLSLGEIGANVLNNNKLFIYNTPQYQEIVNKYRPQNVRLITFEECNNINFINENASSTYGAIETVDQIRQNAPNMFKSQGRLVTTNDFRAYVESNFANLVQDVKVVNNWEYLDGHVKYLYNIGLKSPSQDSRVLYNQVKYADSCNFNDVYIYTIPKLYTKNSLTPGGRYLSPVLKQKIISSMDSSKMTTVEPVMMDPVYVGVSFGLTTGTLEEVEDVNMILAETKLIIQKNPNVYTSEYSIKEKVLNTFKEFFNPSTMTFDFFLNIDALSQKLLEIQGVSSIFTYRKGVNYENNMPGVSLLVFNPVYSNFSEDVMITSQNTAMPFYKVPFLYDEKLLEKNIVVIDSNYVDSGTREF